MIKIAQNDSSPVQHFDTHQSASTDGSELLTIAEVAKILKTSITSVRRLQQKRRIAFYKVGGGLRFAKCDVVKYLADRRVGPIE